jgi:hypothetical protein
MLTQLDGIKKDEEDPALTGPDSFYIRKPTLHESPAPQLAPDANQSIFVTPPEDQVANAGEGDDQEAPVEPFDAEDTPLKQRLADGGNEFVIHSHQKPMSHTSLTEYE